MTVYAFPIHLTLVSRCKCKNQLYGFGNKAFSELERRGATFSIRSGTFANHTEGTELQPIRWLLAGSVPKEEKCQAVSESGGRHRVHQKVMRTCEAIMDTAEAWHFSRYREADDF